MHNPGNTKLTPGQELKLRMQKREMERQARERLKWPLRVLWLVSGSVFIFMAAFLFSAPEREKSGKINKAIFPAFRSIEDYCINSEALSGDEYERCKKVTEEYLYCSDRPYACDAEEYYTFLQELQFELPPFYAE